MSIRLYRAALRLLPADLHRKHGGAMAVLFEREVEAARARGSLHVAVASVRSVWDVMVRAAYEQVRSSSNHNSNAPLPTTRELLRGLAASFAISVVLLTLVLTGLYARNMIPRQLARGASDSIAQVLLLSIPFNAALAIPMGGLLAVLVQFAHLGANGTLLAAQRTRNGVRRLVQPVMLAATGITALAFIVTAELVPRTNHQLSGVFAGATVAKGEREMTLGQLREATRVAKVADAGRSRVSMLEVEVQKKLSLPAACIVFALAGMALAFAFPRGGNVLVVIASVAIYSMYYTMLMTGETLADRHVISPAVAMWGANAVLLSLALLTAARQARSVTLMPPA
jgi:lipopolysaccharide export LptBFGC system permease protein LptF